MNYNSFLTNCLWSNKYRFSFKVPIDILLNAKGDTSLFPYAFSEDELFNSCEIDLELNKISNFINSFNISNLIISQLLKNLIIFV